MQPAIVATTETQRCLQVTTPRQGSHVDQVLSLPKNRGYAASMLAAVCLVVSICSRQRHSILHQLTEHMQMRRKFAANCGKNTNLYDRPDVVTHVCCMLLLCTSWFSLSLSKQNAKET